jgi:peptide/nickel transport system ATP-binding protein
MAQPVLRIEDLKVDFATEDGVVHAVGGISLEVAPGKMLGVVGESGSGKSVSMLTVMGLTRSENATISGSAYLEGRDLLKLPNEELRRIRGNEVAMIFQDPLSSMHPFYKVGAQLMEAILVHHEIPKREARERAIELLRQVGIPDPAGRIDSYPHEFSGGMRQRAMIAMALANDPKVLIADEPTTALDVTVQSQILDLIARLQRERDMAVVLITHDLGVVAEHADEIAVMYAGKVIERAPTDQIFDAPEHPYTWGLLQSIPRLDRPRDEPLVPIPGRPPSLISLPSGCAFSPRCTYVLERHRRVEPPLEPVPDQNGHLVACLLAPSTRRQLWAELQAGKLPQFVRDSVKLQDSS